LGSVVIQLYAGECSPRVNRGVRECTGHAPRAHLKGMLHQESRIKSEDLFMEKYPFPEKYLSF